MFVIVWADYHGQISLKTGALIDIHVGLGVILLLFNVVVVSVLEARYSAVQLLK